MSLMMVLIKNCAYYLLEHCFDQYFCVELQQLKIDGAGSFLLTIVSRVEIYY